MKKTLFKLWGIGMVVVLVSSLFIVGAAPVAADDLDWGAISLLSSKGTLAPGSNVGKIVIAPTGTFFALVDEDEDGDYDAIYSSFNGYKKTESELPGYGLEIIDIAVSPAYDTDGTVFALVDTAAGPRVIFSQDEGSTFDYFSVVIGTAAGAGRAIAVAPNYTATEELMVSTSEGTYIWNADVMTWELGETGNALPAFDVEYSPNFTIDGTRVAVDGTGIHTLVGSSGEWDKGDLAAVATVAGAAGTQLAFPSDFLALDEDNRELFVSVVGVGVYKAEIGSGSAADDMEMDATDTPQSICFSGTLDDGVLFAGASNNTNVYVCENPDSKASNADWDASGGDPSGEGRTFVAVASTYAATGKVYAGTSGVQSAFSVSADNGDHFYQTTLIDTSTLGIADFYFISEDEAYLLTYTELLATVTGDDFAAGDTFAVDYLDQDGAASSGTVTIPNGADVGDEVEFVLAGGDSAAINIVDINATGAPTSATAGAGFDLTDPSGNVLGSYDVDTAVYTDGVATPAAATADSLWRTSNASDEYPSWDRIRQVNLAYNTGLLAFSPDFDSDGTLVIGDISTNVMYVTNNFGDTFTSPTVDDINIGCIAVKDQYNMYVGDPAGAKVQMTTSGGWWWQKDETVVVGGWGGGAVTALAVDPTTGDILVGLSTGSVYISQDNNVEYDEVGDESLDSDAIVGVAFGLGYDADANDTIYAATADTVGRYPGPDSGLWKDITPDDGALVPADVDSVQGLEMTPDGTLYLTDANDQAAYRSINPTDKIVEWSIAPYTAALGTFNVAEGSNVICALSVGTYGASIVAYTDTLTQAVAAAVSPADASILDSSDKVTLVWEEVESPSTSIEILYEYETAWDDTFEHGAVSGYTDDPYIMNLALALEGETYYWRVRVAEPLLGPWSETRTFMTQLEPEAPNAPGIIPAEGSSGNTGPGGYDTSLTPTCQWGAVGSATGYNFQLSDDYSMETLLIEETVEATVYQITISLEYGTTYYWRVQGISDTSSTAWSSINAFTTMAEPEADEPVVTVTQDQPTYTIEMPEPTTYVIEEGDTIATGYIWAIIIIGAVLVIAVIVLIVRTRRTV